ncbi:MAG: hypothetical protein ACLUNZ_13455, partial [Evtepia sp.]
LILAGSRVQFKSKGFRAFSFSGKRGFGHTLVIGVAPCQVDNKMEDLYLYHFMALRQAKLPHGSRIAFN